MKTYRVPIEFDAKDDETAVMVAQSIGIVLPADYGHAPAVIVRELTRREQFWAVVTPVAEVRS